MKRAIIIILLAVSSLGFGQRDRYAGRSFGATVFLKATGVADDVQINAAMAALGAVGGVVVLAPGSYAIAATISIPSNVTLCGAGDSTILTLDDSVTATMITNTNTTPGSRDSTGDSNIIICDMLIDGNKDGQGSGADTLWCVGFTTVENLTIENLTVVDGWTAGIRTEFCTRVVIANNRIRYSGDDGIAINEQSYYVSCYGNDIREAGNSRTFNFDAGSGGTAWAATHILTGDTTNDQSGSIKSKVTIESISITSGSFAGTDAVGTVTVTAETESGFFVNDETLTSDTGGATGNVNVSMKEYGAPYGIEVQDGSHDITVFGNRVVNCQAGGIAMTVHDTKGSSYNVTFANNAINRCHGGIKIDGQDAGSDIQKDVSVISNAIFNDYYTTNSYAISTSYVENINVVGNSIRTTGGGMQYTIWNENTSIIGNNLVNTATDSTLAGINLATNLTHCVIRDNLIKDFNFQGIRFSTSFSGWGVQITNNSIVGSDRSAADGYCVYWNAPTEETISAFDASGPDLITLDTGEGDLTTKFRVGMRVSVEGSTNNDGNYLITAVVWDSTNTIITIEAGDLTDDTLGSAVAEAFGRNCVIAGNYFESDDFWSRDSEGGANDQLPAQGDWAATYPNIEGNLGT